MTARRNTGSADAPRMGEIRHVHTDHDPRAFHWFARGPVVVADGGRPGDDDAAGRDVADERIRDVAHEPTHGEGANRVWDRGDEADAE